MTGSHDLDLALVPFADAIIQARVEALKQLADGLSERVAVLDREFNLIYANQAAWSGTSQPGADARPAKCYEAFVKRQDPCGTCPAMKVFETREVRTLSCSVHGDGSACGMHQAFPMMSVAGDVGSVLVLFKHGPVRRMNGVDASNAAVSAQQMPEEARMGELIGKSPAMQQLFHMIRLVADSSATVLIQGESGTGKELVAKTIHQLSYRRTKPFVVVDCGSLPETLLERELFGHVKGSFTSAGSSRSMKIACVAPS